MKAVLDRLGGEYAVVLLGQEQFRLVLPLSCLPGGARENDILEVSINIGPRKNYEKRQKISRLHARTTRAPMLNNRY
ncbi:DUF3006 domain-containing protein [Desulfotomaculum copahuensis]|uniref:DUF3006 domain-containing protein n=1 Tax=Desulfotomaculum copahuensis TaxID=1838280 RepID=A0A1B7LAQ9_9FIRM|nr:DUF3006 domain-containing protein [Desulfotomaculum copahuensis]OAT79396.1 hypothetical protein A6M21_01280 [Desulfotomaculum copahuensis]